MSTTPKIQPRTRLFARVLGPYLAIAALTVIGRGTQMRAMVDAFVADAVWPWVAGAFVLPMGLTVIALHPYWRGPAAAIVSLLGWLAVFKGLGLMAFPETYLSMGHTAVGATPWWQVGSAVFAVAGLYLTYIGWIPAGAAQGSPRSAEAVTPELGHAR